VASPLQVLSLSIRFHVCGARFLHRVHARPDRAPLSPPPRVEEAPSDSLAEPERRVKLEKARRRKRRIISLVVGVITSVFGYSAAGVVNIVLIVGRFYDDSISFMCLSAISIGIILCALYKRCVFQAIGCRSHR
jgi:hypothetical protein